MARELNEGKTHKPALWTMFPAVNYVRALPFEPHVGHIFSVSPQ